MKKRETYARACTHARMHAVKKTGNGVRTLRLKVGHALRNLLAHAWKALGARAKEDNMRVVCADRGSWGLAAARSGLG